MTACPQCAAEVGGGDRFCEACGFDLVDHTMPAPAAAAVPAPAAAAVPAQTAVRAAAPGAARVSLAGEAVEVAGTGRWVSSARPVTVCAGCGGTSLGAEGYCADCG